MLWIKWQIVPKTKTETWMNLTGIWLEKGQNRIWVPEKNCIRQQPDLNVFGTNYLSETDRFYRSLDFDHAMKKMTKISHSLSAGNLFYIITEKNCFIPKITSLLTVVYMTAMDKLSVWNWTTTISDICCFAPDS